MKLFLVLTCLLNLLLLTPIKFHLNGKTIDLTGDNVTIESDNFKVDKTGKVTATSGTIGGYDLGTDNFNAELYTDWDDYTEEDLVKIKQYIMKEIDLTEEEIARLDVYQDGKISAHDYMKMKEILAPNVSKNRHGKIAIQRKDPYETFKFTDGDGNTRLSLGLSGICFAGIDLFNELFYSKGDNIGIENCSMVSSGHVTSSKKNIEFTVITDKNMLNIDNITLSELKLNIRTADGGYIGASAYTSGGYNFLSSYTVTATKITNNAIRIVIAASSSFDCTNNIPVAVEINKLSATLS